VCICFCSDIKGNRCTMCVGVCVGEGGCMCECSCAQKVLRPVTSTQVFLGFPVSMSEC